MSIPHLTSDDFYAEIEKGPVLVDFWAGWCMPCKMLAPVIEELDAEAGGKVKVAKLDVDAAESVAMDFGVMSIPTVILFRDGREQKRFVGVQPKEVYVNALAPYLGGGAPSPQDTNQGEEE